MAPFLDNNLKTFRTLQIIIASICIFIPVIFRSCDDDSFFPVKVRAAALKKIASCKSYVQLDTTTMCTRGNDPMYRLKLCKTDVLVDSIIIMQKGKHGFRPSLSAYAYGSRSYLFGLFYCMAGMLFIFNGAIYINNLQLQKLYPLSNRSLAINKFGPWYNIVIGASLLGVVLSPQYDFTYLHYTFTALFFIGNFIVLAVFPNANESKRSRIGRIILSLSVVAILAALLSLCRITVLEAEWFSLAIIGLHLIIVAASARNT